MPGLGNVQITPQLVQAVRDAVDVVAVASEHTRLRKAGRRYQGLCPLHKEKTPSFSVDPVQGLFYCFGCGQGGDAIKLHMLLAGDDFPAAIESLATRYGIPLPARAERRRSGRPERDVEGALQAAAEFFAVQLDRDPLPRRYLEKRKIPRDLASRFGVGYAPDSWHALQQDLERRVALADLEAAGLVGRNERGDLYDRFRHRLVFPIHNASGRLVGFGGRTLGDDKAKYLNTAETESFHKGTLLYGLHHAKRAVRESGRAYLVEGYFDVLGTVASGVEGAVAGMGTALTPEQARLLARYAEEVVVGYDGDRAGETAHLRALPLLLAEGLGVRRARFPAGHDPDSLRLAEGEEAVRSAFDKAPDAVTLELERLVPAGAAREPRLQAKAARDATELLRPIPDAILRFGYARLAADRLRVPPEMLARRLEGQGDRPGGPRAGTAAPNPSPPAARLVRTLEEEVLRRLLSGGPDEPLPPPGEMPPAEVFFDADCRNIYRAFRALYGEGEGSPPGARAVLAALGSEGRAIDRMAQVLLEGEFNPGQPGLGESLDKLERRWRRQRLRELATEIGEAQRLGDGARLENLLREKTSLSRAHHTGSTRRTI
ncbi:MAG TPA: DNA primase [Thermoanaerobaculia bacterium]|nr:DNA primase [Thermoanaerobaculia bacterium]